MISGLISVGTNSTRAVVAEIQGGSGRVILQRSTGTRIGEGLKERGHLDERAMQRTLDAIRDHYEAIRRMTHQIGAIATSALRRADNAAEFIESVRQIIGSDLQVISGEDEARYSYAGAVSGLEKHAGDHYGVADTGGGSTEYAVGSSLQPDRLVSCEIGAVRLTEAVPELAGHAGPVSDESVERARSIAVAALAPIVSFQRAERLVLVGGSATTTISVIAGQRMSSPYAELPRAALQRTIAHLRSLDCETRKLMPGMNPQRADILLAGEIVLDALLELTGHDAATVSTNDILLGCLLHRASSPLVQ